MEKFFQEKIKRGSIIEGPFWLDPIEIIEIEELETNQENFKIKIGYRNTRTSIFDTQILDKEDLKKNKNKSFRIRFFCKSF